jgi:hypothetical protein
VPVSCLYASAGYRRLGTSAQTQRRWTSTGGYGKKPGRANISHRMQGANAYRLAHKETPPFGEERRGGALTSLVMAFEQAPVEWSAPCLEPSFSRTASLLFAATGESDLQ